METRHVKNPIPEACERVKKSYKLQDVHEGTALAQAAISSMMSELSRMTSSQLLQIRKELRDDDVGLLFGVSTDAAADAFVHRDVSHLDRGLLALIVENCQRDSRDTAQKLTILGHSAQRMGVDLRSRFAVLRSKASDPFLSFADEWFRHPRPSIESMGYREGRDRWGNFSFVTIHKQARFRG
jgi:hypothetical protein